ncbi:Hsp70-binding protein 1 [Armadillidium vulgare]|nr:Hsp70-binding protein 1 [Armadillidium vulgare]
MLSGSAFKLKDGSIIPFGNITNFLYHKQVKFPGPSSDIQNEHQIKTNQTLVNSVLNPVHSYFSPLSHILTDSEVEQGLENMFRIESLEYFLEQNMAEGNNDQGNRERLPKNLQGLLNFCTEITAREDTTQPSSATELSQERREFLEKVLAGFQGDVAKCMANLLKKLTDPSVFDINSDVSEQEEALEQLGRICVVYTLEINYMYSYFKTKSVLIGILFKTDLFKMNGFPTIVNVLDSPHYSLQKGAAQVIGDICQNNEVGQQNMLPLNVMQKLLNIIDNHSDPECMVKALYALSCLTRESEMAEKMFSDLSGFCYLMRAIQTKQPKLVVKSVFLLNYFIGKTDKYKDTLLSMGFVDQLISILFSEDIDDTSREYCTLSLYNLSTSYDKALQECQRPEFNLVFQLNERLKTISGNDQYQVKLMSISIFHLYLLLC